MKRGDKVVCVNSVGTALKVGNIYEIEAVGEAVGTQKRYINWIMVKGDTTLFAPDRFVRTSQ